MFSICHKPQQPRPACRDKDIKSVLTMSNYTNRQNENKTSCTFESGYLPRLCFGQALLTSVSGQCQRDTTTAQQKANLLTSCILEEQ